ncbi:tRNA 4-thiouridine(8) synthase ThiI [Bacillus sp. HMF5848]|uniref:tRNA uracil 4-sulfurtransferase ThiI n=1 Tax=Bacillus sp. HMF5848 TaxID=2495421 RepID=UPI000F78011E|nr:tRNA uracil 4-sulfurtransferase ThiI [Bacillus sp. HMF5848]RSK28182.1 tRNA 4-thiouridine(8) synthase ThiI [Bacillus sp. HMF5848]
MVYDHILIRYGEISTKGRNRKRFVSQLQARLKALLIEYPNAFVKQSRDRMYIVLNGEPHEPIIEALKHVFGIQSFSLAIKTDNNIEQIKEAALKALHDSEKTITTFKVSTRRAYKQFPHDSNELNHIIGGHILRHTKDITVDVHNPDINVGVEVREHATYITCVVIPGAGGLPPGSSGKGLLMLSGGIDSPVAGYLAMKRGLELEAVHFFTPPYTSERAKQKVIDLAEMLQGFSGKMKLHIVPFTEIQLAISQQVPDNYVTISTRRMMFKIADKIRNQINGLAIVTGDSLGQVASQTLESMFAINEVTTTPIIRPLITTDKTEIIKIAKNINTYDISIRPYEDCCSIFTPSSPKTKPKVDKIDFFESFVDFDEMIDNAIANTEIMVISNQTKIKFEELF